MTAALKMVSGCTDCGVCALVCEANAITFTHSPLGDQDGRFVDQTQCVNCGLCVTHCPALRPVPRHPVVACKAATAPRPHPTAASGGMVTAIATAAINKGWSVCASVADTDGIGAHHVIIDSLAQLPAIAGSRYVMSETLSVFPEIKRLVRSGTQVLYVSVSCQVEALLAYLGQDRTNLWCIELLCSANLTPQVVAKHVADNGAQGYLHRVHNFTSPGMLWFADGSMMTEGVRRGLAKARLERTLCRRACIDCTHHTFARVGDLVMGDYWGRYTHHRNLPNKVSMAMIVTPDGQRLYDMAPKSMDLVLTPDQAKTNNCIDFPLPPDTLANNESYHREFQNKPLWVINRPLYDVELSSCTTVPNYGSVLLSWAVYDWLLDNGYKVQLNSGNVGLSNAFAGDPRAAFAAGYPDKPAVGSGASAILLRSGDQQWNWEYNNRWYDDQLFAGRKEPKVAYGVSFGGSSGRRPIAQVIGEHVDKLKAFRAIGMRETTDVAALAAAGVKATRVADNVFLRHPDRWREMMAPKVIDGPYMLWYMPYGYDTTTPASFMRRYPGVRCVPVGNYLEKGLDLQPLQIRPYTPSEFLRLVHDATVVFTNSLHGVYFSILFGVPVVLQQRMASDDRITTLKDVYGVSAVTNATDPLSLNSAFYDKGRMASVVARERTLGQLWLTEQLQALL